MCAASALHPYRGARGKRDHPGSTGPGDRRRREPNDEAARLAETERVRAWGEQLRQDLMFGTPAPEPEEDPDAEPYHNADDQQLREAEPDIAPAEKCGRSGKFRGSSGN